MLIYSAYIEEQSKLEAQEKQIMREDSNYYYNEGIKEVDKTKKDSIIPMALFLALLDKPNYSGFSWEQYIKITIQYNAQQIYKQALYNIQAQKSLEINSSDFQTIINRQNNQKLNINGDKISGAVDLQMIGLDNLAKVEGIKKVAGDNAKVKFIAVEDDRTTLMCDSLNNQEFYINKENVFDRYYGENQKNLRIERVRCQGLVLGLNLPTIMHHYHHCRSTIMYLPPVEKQGKIEYNKLGNSNKNGTGGNGKGTFIEKIDLKDKNKKIQEYEEQIRNMKSEFAVIIDTEGNIYAYQGSKTNLDITDRKLDNTIITHNHPEVGSFGKDDFELLKANNKIKELRAVDSEYNYSLKILKDIDVTYNEIYVEGAQLAFETGEDIQHCTMETLKERGYIKYERRRKRES